MSAMQIAKKENENYVVFPEAETKTFCQLFFILYIYFNEFLQHAFFITYTQCGFYNGMAFGNRTKTLAFP